jgi:hypothetical protein
VGYDAAVAPRKDGEDVMRFVWPIHYADPAALGEIAQRTPIRLHDSPIVEIAKLLARFNTGGTSSVTLPLTD